MVDGEFEVESEVRDVPTRTKRLTKKKDWRRRRDERDRAKRTQVSDRQSRGQRALWFWLMNSRRGTRKGVLLKGAPGKIEEGCGLNWGMDGEGPHKQEKGTKRTGFCRGPQEKRS